MKSAFLLCIVHEPKPIVMEQNYIGMKLALKLSARSVIYWIFLVGRNVEFITILDIYADIKST